MILSDLASLSKADRPILVRLEQVRFLHDALWEKEETSENGSGSNRTAVLLGRRMR